MVRLGFKFIALFAQGFFCPYALFNFLFELGIDFRQLGGSFLHQILEMIEQTTVAFVEAARYLNEHFIAIKVDREARPDIDEIYMAATLAMNDGQGGWPMTVFLTPDQEPFFAGTYFPPEDRPEMMRFGVNLTVSYYEKIREQRGQSSGCG